MADLTNYSPDDALDEFVTDRARGPLLLRHAADIAGIDYVVEGLVKRGFRKGVINSILKYAGLQTAPKRERAVSEDPFRDQLARLWTKDRERFIAITEELYNDAAVAQ